MQARESVLLVTIVALVALAGCSSLGSSTADATETTTPLSSDAPAIANLEFDVYDGIPVLAFEYALDDYATVLVEDPDGNIIAESTLSPNDEWYAAANHDPQPGGYRVVLRRNGETLTDATQTFDGATPRLESVDAEWSSGSLEAVRATVTNTGDQPAYVESITYSDAAETASSEPRTWIGPGETATVSASAGFGESITVDEPGTVEITTRIDLATESLIERTHHTFEGPTLEIVDVTQHWDKNHLKTMAITVANTGDLKTGATVSIRHADEQQTSTRASLAPGDRQTVTLGGTYSIYTAETPGRLSFDVVAETEDSHRIETVTHTVEEAAVELIEIAPQWDAGILKHVQVSVRNTGELTAKYTADVSVNGESIHDAEEYLDPGETATETLQHHRYDWIYAVDSGGEKTVTVELRHDGNSVSKSQTTEISPPTAEITELDPNFLEIYDSDNLRVTTLDTAIENTGETVILYDSARITIDNSTHTVDKYTVELVKPGEMIDNFPYFGIELSPGTHDVTIEIQHEKNTIVTATGTIDTDDDS